MVNGKTRVFVLLGSPVAHSVSPNMQNAAFRALGINAAYVPLPCQADDVASLMRVFSQAGGGGNVTIPHKIIAAASVTLPSSVVEDIGACNTFWSQGNEIGGDNTDVAGVLAALDRLEAPSSCWLVLGTGGSARAVSLAARERGAAVAVQSRSPVRRAEFEEWLSKVGVRTCHSMECQVVINATPLGLNAWDPLPISPEAVPQVQVALDLVYALEGTPWVHAMRRRGARAVDGREALVVQGAAAFERWFPGERAPQEVMRAVVNARLR